MNRRHFLQSMAVAACAASRLRAEEVSPDRARLNEHRIAAVESRPVRLRYPRPVGRNAVRGHHGTGPTEPVVILRTDQGAAGWALGRVGADGVEALLARLKGRPVGELIDPASGILDPQWRGLDFVLHDLAGRILNKPVYELLGKKGPARHPCYSGMIYFDDLDPEDRPGGIDAVLANVKWDVEHGYRAVKLKIGRGHKWMEAAAGLRRDIEVTRAVRKAFPDVDILVDGNNGFTTETFLEYLKGIDGVKLFWIEEPFQEAREPLMKVRAFLRERKLEVPVAEGEAGFDRKFLLALAAEGLVQVVIPDIEGYGFTPWRGMMPELIQAGVTTSPHTWGTYLRTFYTAHLATGLGNVLTIEGVTSTSEDIDFSDYVLKDGFLTPSPAPGFGMKLPG